MARQTVGGRIVARTWCLGGYVPCACRDCFDVAFVPSHWSDAPSTPAFCHDCEKAGCPDYQGHEGLTQECQREDAYECDDSEVSS